MSQHSINTTGEPDENNPEKDGQRFFSRVFYAGAAHQMAGMPVDHGREIAFAGRSNVGKSSLINAVCRRKQLVKTSKTPGRTRALQFFHLEHDGVFRLVDLPGYGFAKAAKLEQAQWRALVENYLQQRKSLCALVHIMDIRHPLQPLDLQMLQWLHSTKLALLLVLNKADKVKQGQKQTAIHKVKEFMQPYQGRWELQISSCLKSVGIEQIRQWIIGQFLRTE